MEFITAEKARTIATGEDKINKWWEEEGRLKCFKDIEQAAQKQEFCIFLPEGNLTSYIRDELEILGYEITFVKKYIDPICYKLYWKISW